MEDLHQRSAVERRESEGPVARDRLRVGGIPRLGPPDLQRHLVWRIEHQDRTTVVPPLSVEFDAHVDEATLTWVDRVEPMSAVQPGADALRRLEFPPHPVGRCLDEDAAADGELADVESHGPNLLTAQSTCN